MVIRARTEHFGAKMVKVTISRQQSVPEYRISVLQHWLQDFCRNFACFGHCEVQGRISIRSAFLISSKDGKRHRKRLREASKR